MKQSLSSTHPLFCWLMLLLIAGLTAWQTQQFVIMQAQNDLIEAPEEIIVTDALQPDQVIFAKAYALNSQNQRQQALQLFNRIKNSGNPTLRNRVLYNMGSIYLQQAHQLWQEKGVWELDQINTLLDLSEQSLKNVLRADPEFWQARYNLEYVLRIRPPGKEQEEADWTGHKSSVHAVMPGIPSGSP